MTASRLCCAAIATSGVGAPLSGHRVEYGHRLTALQDQQSIDRDSERLRETARERRRRTRQALQHRHPAPNRSGAVHRHTRTQVFDDE